MKINRTELFNAIAACLFIIGAVFMLFNVFGADIWAFFVGIVFAIAACTVLITSYFDARANTNKHGKESTNSPSGATKGVENDPKSVEKDPKNVEKRPKK